MAGTYGLVVCGGFSSRMGADKGLLIYYGKPQRYHLYEMLELFCEKVFISCRAEQANSIGIGYNILTDHASYSNIGPMAALLSAFTRFPKKNILLVGCDYPFLTPTDLQEFLPACREENLAISFYNTKEDLYEPVLAWYHHSSFDLLKKMHASKQYSLQQFLRNNEGTKYYPGNQNSMESVDTREAYVTAYNLIKWNTGS